MSFFRNIKGIQARAQCKECRNKKHVVTWIKTGIKKAPTGTNIKSTKGTTISISDDIMRGNILEALEKQEQKRMMR